MKIEECSEKRRCKTCGEYKDMDCFTKTKECKGGRNYQCKTCLQDYLFLKKNIPIIKIENLEGEVWKNIFKEEDIYQVSNYGRVKSKHNKFKEIILKFFVDRDGYNRVTIPTRYKKSGIVHGLVAEAFIPNPENKPQVNHKNTIKTDNRVENLEWATAQENITHALNNSLTNKGTKNGKSKLTENIVIKIRAEFNEIKDVNPYVFLGKKYNVRRASIYAIIKRKNWKWLD